MLKTASIIFAAICSMVLAPTAFSERIIYDQPTVNGHKGYLTAWDQNGPLDKVFMLVAGFDTENDDHPAQKLDGEYQALIDELAPLGWDIIYFDYVDGTIDLKDNADNLARFIEYLDLQAGTDYHLAIVGGSMGGIVTRTMFVQEYSDMGVDTFVSVDSPHWGVTLSEWVEDLATVFIDYRAGRQMHSEDPLYDEHYGWLRRIENDGSFMPSIIDPMNTCAIALSNGEREWKAKWDDIAIHNKYYEVSSYVAAEGLRSTFMPYHSTIYMNDWSTSKKRRFGYTKYRYKNTASRYFDQTIPNPKKVHGAPEFVIRQALDFVLQNQPQ